MRHVITITGLLFCIFTLLAVAGCSKKTKSSAASIVDNSMSKANLIATNTLEKGNPDCENGGVRIDTGLDQDEDGVLTEVEVNLSKIVCNVAQGFDNLIRIYDEPAGEHCENGGKKIQVGLDRNFDAELGEDEVTDTQYLCDNTVPSSSADNPSSLIKIEEEPASENCSTGGKRIHTGLDTNGSGLLEQDEVIETSYLCNGEKGIDGAVTRSLQSINCRGPLQNLADLLWSYEIHELTSGDSVVSASVYGPDTTVSALSFYSGQELANGVLPVVKFVYDVVAPNNYGSWSIFLDESKGLTFVVYSDPDLNPGPNVWSMSTDNCSVTVFD